MARKIFHTSSIGTLSDSAAVLAEKIVRNLRDGRSVAWADELQHVFITDHDHAAEVPAYAVIGVYSFAAPMAHIEDDIVAFQTDWSRSLVIGTGNDDAPERR